MRTKEGGGRVAFPLFIDDNENGLLDLDIDGGSNLSDVT